MTSGNLVLNYVASCTSGKLGLSDCGPIWQLGVIAVLLVVMVLALLALRLRARAEPEES